MRCDMEQRDCIPAGIAAIFETSPKPLIDIPNPASPSDMATIVRFAEASVMVGTEKVENAVLETIGAEEDEVEAVRCVIFFIVWPSIEASPLLAIADTEICGGGGGGEVR